MEKLRSWPETLSTLLTIPGRSIFRSRRVSKTTRRSWRTNPGGAYRRARPQQTLPVSDIVDSAHFVDIKANIRLKLHLVRAILHIVEDVFRARLAVYSLWLRLLRRATRLS